MGSTEFIFEAPSTVTEALDLLADGEDAMLMAGGTSVVVMLRRGLLSPRRLVWLGRVDELRGIRIDTDGCVSIGALTTLREVASSEPLRRKHRGLVDAAASVGNERVRAVATIGGGLLHGHPRQDVPPVLLALDARLAIRHSGGSREVPLRGFHTGFCETALDEGHEILTHVRIPPVRGRRVAYLRYNPSSRADYPTVGVAASVTVGRLGRITDAAVAIAGAGPVPIEVPDVAGILGGSRPASADLARIGDAARRAADPTTDRFGSSDYKREMAGVWTERALRACLMPGDRR